MNTNMIHLNLLVGWLWILLGFLSGMMLGLCFHRENWLGGYASFKRRMYRLAHISFFGLGVVNFLFALTLKNFSIGTGPGAGFASWCLVAGAVTMPLCCVIMAHFPKARLIFSLPVLCLVLGGALTVATLVQGFKAGGPGVEPQLSTTYSP